MGFAAAASNTAPMSLGDFNRAHGYVADSVDGPHAPAGAYSGYVNSLTAQPAATVAPQSASAPLTDAQWQATPEYAAAHTAANDAFYNGGSSEQAVASINAARQSYERAHSLAVSASGPAVGGNNDATRSGILPIGYGAGSMPAPALANSLAQAPAKTATIPQASVSANTLAQPAQWSAQGVPPGQYDFGSISANQAQYGKSPSPVSMLNVPTVVNQQVVQPSFPGSAIGQNSMGLDAPLGSPFQATGMGPDGMPIHGLVPTPPPAAPLPNGPANWPAGDPKMPGAGGVPFPVTDPSGYGQVGRSTPAQLAAQNAPNLQTTNLLPGQDQLNKGLNAVGVNSIGPISTTIPWGQGVAPGSSGPQPDINAQVDAAALATQTSRASLNPNGNQGGITPSPGSNLGYPPSLNPPTTPTNALTAGPVVPGAAIAASTAGAAAVAGSTGALATSATTGTGVSPTTVAGGAAATPVTTAGGNTLTDIAKAVIPPAIGAITGVVSSNNASKTMADAAIYAADKQNEAQTAALAQQQSQFNATNAINDHIYNNQQNQTLPWVTAGTKALTDLQGTISNHMPFGMDQFQQDPGYQFNLSEGLKALQNSAAARGGLISGNSMKALQDYGQQSASNEYQNAYNRYQTDYGTRLNSLQALSGTGQTAVGQNNQSGSNYMNTSTQAAQNNSAAAGGYMTAGANALAQGATGAANANASGYMGMGNAISNGISGAYGNYGSNALITALTNNLNRGGQ